MPEEPLNRAYDTRQIVKLKQFYYSDATLRCFVRFITYILGDLQCTIIRWTYYCSDRKIILSYFSELSHKKQVVNFVTRQCRDTAHRASKVSVNNLRDN